MTARKFSDEQSFIDRCREAGVKATKRQASKFQRGLGAVYKITVQKVSREKVHIPQKAMWGN